MYLAKHKGETLGRMMHRIVRQRRFSFRRPHKTLKKNSTSLQAMSTLCQQYTCVHLQCRRDNSVLRRLAHSNYKRAWYEERRYDQDPRAIGESDRTVIVSAAGKTYDRCTFLRLVWWACQREVKAIRNKLQAAVMNSAWWMLEYGLTPSLTRPGMNLLMIPSRERLHSTSTTSNVTPGNVVLWDGDGPFSKNTTSILGAARGYYVSFFQQNLRTKTLYNELSVVGSGGGIPLSERLLKRQRMSAPEKLKRRVDRVVAA
ncbi:hypothetical protein GN244_ATG03584 [Phytophthora infestans]|uniref:Uncharacterized protein n=1 Tax=Phytophthora infestans TaxID=4787 RepID=A0A833T122_PHYIN|nr:hypothetical protein GN244_ATG03584 [Phytophthora infestans]